MNAKLAITLPCALLAAEAMCTAFEKLPKAEMLARIPEVVIGSDPALADFTKFAWSLAYDHVTNCAGAAQSPYMDEAFYADRIWVWDSCFMVNCRATQPTDRERVANLYISHVHRGGGAKERPDNTLETFKWCWENGSALECDCRKTKDGVGIMLHDDKLSRTARGISAELANKSVSKELTWDEIKDVDVGSYLGSQFANHRIPTIEETFAAMKGHPTYLCFVDEKGAGPKYIADKAREAGVIGQVYYSGPSYEKAQEWMRDVPDGKTMLWIGTWPVPKPEHDEADLERFEAHYEKVMGEIRAGGYKGISVVSLHSYYNPSAKEPFVPRASYLKKLTEEFHRHGIPVCSIPFAGGETQEAYFKLWELGMDGFSSDYPSVMFKVIRELEKR